MVKADGADCDPVSFVFHLAGEQPVRTDANSNVRRLRSLAEAKALLGRDADWLVALRALASRRPLRTLSPLGEGDVRPRLSQAQTERIYSRPCFVGLSLR